jgi:hypothetical protein
METDAQTLAKSENVYVIAAAGCGKTHLIAQSVGCHKDGKQLLLTHTHAGVRAMKDKLAMLRVTPDRYRIKTICGFALEYAAAYPKLSGIMNPMPANSSDWKSTIESATRLLSQPNIQDILRATYKGAYVDEYQDCTVEQHNLVLGLVKLLPCRILGDPLQGIFGFGKSTIVDWDKDVRPNFQRLRDLETPYRWMEGNQELGDWLALVRNRLENRQPVELTQLPSSVNWVPNTPKTCRAVLSKFPTGSVAAIHRGAWAQQCHFLARHVPGFQSMEEIESDDLFKWACKIESDKGAPRAQAVVDFAKKCITGVTEKDLKPVLDRLQREDSHRRASKQKYHQIFECLKRVSQSDSLLGISDALNIIRGSIPGARLFRGELWYAMISAVKEFATGRHDSLEKAAWHARNRTRKAGRRVDVKCVSRTLLIKGLEFDHAIVLDADGMDYKELYVAMTRGSKSLTIISKKRIINPFADE